MLELHSKQQKNGFTMIELMVTVSVLAIIVMIALPNLSNFTIRMRVDNEISELNRLLLTTRNSAINEGFTVTLCPLNGTVCSNNWQNELTVFADNTNNGVGKLEAGERIIKVKAAIKNGEKLQYSQNLISYDATGHTTKFNVSGNAIDAGGPFTFSYCPQGDANRARGIIVSISGRVYSTSDTNNDDIDEDRNGNIITCT
jgi:type IV fimbrial biogenesis protein FimT